jgi:hypothetical protein
MRLKPSSSLLNASDDRTLVRFTRPSEPGSVKGYIVDVGQKFFMVAIVADDMRFNGFQCFRLSDVRRLKIPAPYAEFAQAALKKRRERIPRKPPVDLSSLPRLLQTANKAFPLVTIHREIVDRGACHIGRVVQIEKSTLRLLEIGPDARRDVEPEQYRLNQNHSG